MFQATPPPSRAPSAASSIAPGSAPPPAAPTATEIVTRPDPGLARGRWEAPVWVFWVVLGAILVGSAAYLLRRLGILRVGGKKADAPASMSPTSSRRRRP